MVYLYDMNKPYTVKQLAAVAGVSVRTLHYYDEIALLKPASVGTNGYRYYDNASLLRLQQILLYRELGFDLTYIKQIVNDPTFDLVSALQSHRHTLQTKIERLNTLIHTVDMTILHIVEEVNMNKKQIFQGFTEEKQQQYTAEATELWGEPVMESVKLWNSYGEERQQEIIAEGNAIYAEIADNMDKSPDSDEVQTILVRWHDHIRYFYEPSIEMLGGLGDLYVDHPDFNATFMAVHPKLPTFLQQAIKHYVDVLETRWLEETLAKE